MEESLKKAIQDAIKEEEYFRKFYSDCAKKISALSVKKLLLKLSDQEAGHKKKLQSLDMQRICAADPKRLNISADLMLTPINEFKEVKEIFEFAIGKEKESMEKYERIAKVVPQKERIIFECIAEEEAGHFKLLKESLKELGI